MAFSRVNPNGWPVNGTVTSAQLNALDIDHANAVDRSAAGDTVAGLIALDGSEASLILPPTTITGAGSTLKTQSGGRIVLGNNDWVEYLTPRSFLRAMPFIAQPGASFLDWNINNNESTNTGTLGLVGNVNLSDFLVDGSVLTAIDIYFIASSAHNGLTNPPEQMPSFALYGQSATNPTDVQQVISGTISSPASGTAWYSSGNVQVYTLIVPSLTIDNAAASYYLRVTDESGSTYARAGNIYQSLRLNFTCADMRPR